MLWHDLKMAVHARKPSNLRELAAYCHKEWARISQDRCKKLVSSYRNRLLAVVGAKGGCTKYYHRGVITFAHSPSHCSVTQQKTKSARKILLALLNA
jgi:hypothetical protein